MILLNCKKEVKGLSSRSFLEGNIMDTIYVTITGTNYYYGTKFIEKKMETGDVKIKLVKEPDNEYDKEAIKAIINPFGKIGHVANSVHTVIGECYSAGRVYDKIGDNAIAIVEYVLPEGIICRVDL